MEPGEPVKQLNIQLKGYRTIKKQKNLDRTIADRTIKEKRNLDRTIKGRTITPK